ncbi:MAG: hypothetical protein JO336_04795 [Acidobacteriia bacterium]|nr:hypothetical protein [Terriglobia bacterium]MBV9268389.1 hypothetical protein [Acidobacteriaceae bacterium]
MTSSRNRYLETAARIGARICRDAIWSGNRCNWMGDSMEKLDGAWKVAHRALGPDLYGGTSGIALFLIKLHSLTNEALLRETAEAAVLQAYSRVPYIAIAVRPSFYLGLTGIAWTLASLGWEDKAREVLHGVPAFADVNTDVNSAKGAPDAAAVLRGFPNSFDVIGGLAGAIPALLALSTALCNHEWADVAVRYGDALLKLARKSDRGWSWNTMGVAPERRREDLTGFSHGAAGIAWAFSELFQATGDVRFREAAEQSRRYENSYFDPRCSNWPDFRYLYDPDTPSNGGPSYPTSWCHGAPGIGLDRLRGYQILGNESLKDDAMAAIRTTASMLKYTPGSNFSLCHGLGGNADLLIYAAAALDDTLQMRLAEAVGDQGIEQFEDQNFRWPCGVTDGDQTPNLMLGTAGIGYFYLRLYDPNAAGSVLLLPVPHSQPMPATATEI